MHVIIKRRLDKFIQIYPDAQSGLELWYRIIRNNNFDSLEELTKFMPNIKVKDNFIIFKLCNDKVYLITTIHFNHYKIYIRNVLNYKNYNKIVWKE